LTALSGVIAIYVGLWAAFAFLLVSGFAGGVPADGGEALLAPLAMLISGAVVLGMLAHAGTSMATIAVVDVAAAAGLSSVVAFATPSSFWKGPFVLLFDLSPALLLIGAAFALLEFLKGGAPASIPNAGTTSEVSPLLRAGLRSTRSRPR
jgi:hypothetical protein